jgi:hypothetical protein
LALGRVGLGYLALSRVFSGWVGFWVQNYGLYMTRELLWVKNYGLYPPIAMIETGWAGYFQEDRIGLVGSDSS